MQNKFIYILTLACPDRAGIVHEVSGFLSSRNINIITSAQFFDQESGRFFMRVKLNAEVGQQSLESLKKEWLPIADKWRMQAQWFDLARKPRVLIMVSKAGHCLNDLLFQAHTGRLPVEIVAVGSNHETLRKQTEHYDIPFYHWPINGMNDSKKGIQENKLKETVEELNVDIVVLARYMQILSPSLCAFLEGRAINIHHSFLPSFKGAKPYHQAHARGVKLIGATAHYVTTDLDEGPIIEQDVARVSHDMDITCFTDIGKDIERVVLAKALLYQAEHRILRNGNKTIVFN